MDNIIIFMDKLVEEGQILDDLSNIEQSERERQNFDRRFIRWRKNVIEILTYASMESHLREAQATANNGFWYGAQAPILAGLLESAHDLIRHGFVGKIKFLLHAEMFSSIVQQAKALNEAGHTIPAAVLGRIAIEDWLKDQAEKASIRFSVDAKASSINELLRKASIFSTPRWRQVQALLDIGNSAAHGKAEDFSQVDVSKLLEFVETNCT